MTPISLLSTLSELTLRRSSSSYSKPRLVFGRIASKIVRAIDLIPHQKLLPHKQLSKAAITTITITIPDIPAAGTIEDRTLEKAEAIHTSY
jgi:hypothetical protein